MLAQVASKENKSIPTSKVDTTELLKSSWVSHIPTLLISGHLDASSVNFSLDIPYFQDKINLNKC